MVRPYPRLPEHVRLRVRHCDQYIQYHGVVAQEHEHPCEQHSNLVSRVRHDHHAVVCPVCDALLRPQ